MILKEKNAIKETEMKRCHKQKWNDNKLKNKIQ